MHGGMHSEELLLLVLLKGLSLLQELRLLQLSLLLLLLLLLEVKLISSHERRLAGYG